MADWGGGVKVSTETRNGVISDHEMWVWSKFIRHSHWMGTVAEEIRKIEF